MTVGLTWSRIVNPVKFEISDSRTLYFITFFNFQVERGENMLGSKPRPRRKCDGKFKFGSKNYLFRCSIPLFHHFYPYEWWILGCWIINMTCCSKSTTQKHRISILRFYKPSLFRRPSSVKFSCWAQITAGLQN